MAKKSLYQLLEVNPSASAEVILAAHAARSAALAADTSAQSQAERALLRDALEILGDPAQRARYDASLREEMRRALSSGTDAPVARSAGTRHARSASAGDAPGAAAGLPAKLVAASVLLAAAAGGTWVWLDHARKLEAQRLEAERVSRELKLKEEEALRRAEQERLRRERAEAAQQRSDESREAYAERQRLAEIERSRSERLTEMQREQQADESQARRKAAEQQRSEMQRQQQERENLSRQQTQLERERRMLRELEQNRGMKF